MNARSLSYLLVLFFSAISGQVLAAPFQMGTATLDITPPVGYRMSGYFHERLSEGIKDPLLAKAIVFSQGDTVAAIVCCDLVGIFNEVAHNSRQLIETQTGIPPSHVSITATHSHTGPLYFGALRDHFHAVAVARDGTDPHEQFDYPSFFTQQLADVVQQAKENLADVTFSAGCGHEDRIAFNRRFLMKDGRVKTWIGLNHPDVIGTAGPIDPEIGLIRFDSSAAQPLALLSSYALHLDTVGGTLYSADYPFYLQEALARHYGDHFVSLFGIGTCGDINHADTQAKERNKTDAIGAMLSESVLAALPILMPSAEASLAVKHRVIHVPKQEYSAERVAQAQLDMAHVGDRSVETMHRVETYKIVALEYYKQATVPLEIHAFRLSPDVAIVTLPGEVFVEFGLHIKENSPFDTTLVIELANAAPGYIPTKKAFVEGGYETVNSRVAPGGGEKMAASAIELLQELKP